MLIFVVDELHRDTQALLKDSLLTFAGNACICSEFKRAPEVCLCCVRRSAPGADVKLQMLYKAKSLSLREWSFAVNKLQGLEQALTSDTLKLSSALKALLSHLANDHQLSTIAVLAHHYQATPQIGYAIQEAAKAGIHITFFCLQPPAVQRELQETTDLAAFVSQITCFDNASYFEYRADALDLDRMLLRILHQLIHSSNQAAPSMSGALTLAIPTSTSGTPAALFRCTLVSQIMRLQPHLQLLRQHDLQGNKEAPAGSAADSPSIPLTFQIGNQILCLEPSAASKLAQHMAAVQAGRVSLVVQRVVPASKVDLCMVYGWPHILCADNDAGLAGEEATESAALMAAICKLLSQRGQLLLATSMMHLTDAGQCLPMAWQQWYVLTPSPNGPAFLLKHLACREQLALPLASPSALAPLTDQQLDEASNLLRTLPGGSCIRSTHCAATGELHTADSLEPAPAVGFVNSTAASSSGAAHQLGDRYEAAGGSAASDHAVTGHLACGAAPDVAYCSPLDLSCGCKDTLADLVRASVRPPPPAPPAAGVTAAGVTAVISGGTAGGGAAAGLTDARVGGKVTNIAHAGVSGQGLFAGIGVAGGQAGQPLKAAGTAAPPPQAAASSPSAPSPAPEAGVARRLTGGGGKRGPGPVLATAKRVARAPLGPSLQVQGQAQKGQEAKAVPPPAGKRQQAGGRQSGSRLVKPPLQLG